ncbi:MBL fold metallo-hydrolase [Nocardioides marmoriginsengisoli]|uniref:MBL fold metallo-hydrolase n=1 Tax=Nocardioides marmoriginsengisoli TaxID=661483 RepID=A0A3N0CH10_9ACTN|nr:MBL fold metallo-hydrolase [Nocardioides marmoriginsengisoli]RNL62293.1 MBL fold metallo-hydrolase [Nocardioides marmoriginsengisoli]
MRIFKHGHACVRIEASGQVIVLDPGMFTERDAVDGATAILITHEHADHWSAEQLAATDAPIYTIAAVAEQIRAASPAVAERVRVVAAGERFDLGGTAITAVGEKHAIIHPELPHFDNSGYLLEVGDRTVFHPGDALTTLPAAPDVLLLPVSAPWMKVSECIDYAREVGAPLSVAIHDAVYSDAGLGIVDAHLGRFLAPRQQEYRRLPAGTEL